MSEGMGLGTGADDDDVTGVHTAFKTLVHKSAKDEAAQAKGDGQQDEGENDDASRHRLTLNHVEGAGQQQAGHQARLNA